MARVLYTPGCWASVVTGPLGSAPVKLPRILHAETNLTLAPAVGAGQLIIADPDGKWAGTLRPNDIVRIVFSSRARQTQAAQVVPGVGATAAATSQAASWTGLVDEALAYYDPRAPYGRACQLILSSYWKLFDTTAVPLSAFFTGQYPQPNITIVQMFTQAVAAVAQNTGVNVVMDPDPALYFVNTGPLSVPNDTTDPSVQSWAAWLLSTVVPAGVEVFFDETGVLNLRQPAYMQDTAVLSIPNEEIFAAQPGVSDVGLVTNTVVSYGLNPKSIYAETAPRGGLSSIGPLPPQLQDGSGNPLPRLGKRFVGLRAGWITQPDQAGKYAASVRALGMANVDKIEGQIALNGDLRIGTTIAAPGLDRRYYLATVSHFFDFGSDAQTTISGRFGMPTGAVWDRSVLNSYSQLAVGGTVDLSPTDPTQVQDANLSPLAADPDVRWLANSTPIGTADIARFLSQHQPPSPLAPYANLIWVTAQQTGILPEFALAVWQAETQCGTDGSAGSTSFNPGNVGPGNDYPDWQTAITAWFGLLASATYVGGGHVTVSEIGAIYAPNDKGQNPNWIPNVTQTMRTLRAGSLTPGVASTAGQPGNAASSGTQPAGSPFGPDIILPITQPFGNRSYLEPAGTYQGVRYANPGFHRGIDFGCAVGTKLYATMDGQLRGGDAIFDAATGYGFCLYLLNGPWIVKYGHTEGFAPGAATDGQMVSRGDLIGLSDTTGNATGPHLHYEIDRGDLDTFLDPSPFLAS